MLIGEVSAQTGLSRRMLRHYDELELVSPSGRSAAGNRQYADADLRRLLQVEALRSLGLSLAEVASALDDPDYRADRTVADLAERARRRIAAETQLLDHLEAIGSSAPATWEGVLALVSKLHALRGESPRARQRAALDPDNPLDVKQLVKVRISEEETNVAGALDWAIARAGDSALAALSDAVRSDDPRKRVRAVRALASIDLPGATDVLHGVLDDADPAVRTEAALEVGRRGLAGVAGHLVELVVEGRHDVEAAEILGELASSAPTDEGIERELVERLSEEDLPIDSRRRLTQALAEFCPGPVVDAALDELSADPDPQVAFTAQAIARGR